MRHCRWLLGPVSVMLSPQRAPFEPLFRWVPYWQSRFQYLTQTGAVSPQGTRPASIHHLSWHWTGHMASDWDQIQWMLVNASILLSSQYGRGNHTPIKLARDDRKLKGILFALKNYPTLPSQMLNVYWITRLRRLSSGAQINGINQQFNHYKVWTDCMMGQCEFNLSQFGADNSSQSWW